MTDITPLFPDDVEAMRRARGVTLIADSAGRAKVRAMLERNDGDEFTGVEQRIFPEVSDWRNERTREFACNGFARRLDMSPGDDPLAGKRLIGTHFVMASQYHGAWRTIAHLLRPGNGLELQFLADHSTNANHRRVDFHGDDLYLRIWTRIQSRDNQFAPAQEFLLETSVGPHDSARLVRAEHEPAQATTTLSIDDYFREGAFR